MADRIDLIVSLGVLLKEAEARGEPATAETLRAAITAIVETHDMAAKVERRKATDRKRKRNPSTESEESTESAGSSSHAPSTESTESSAVGGIRVPLPPAPSLLPPTPPNNPSSPPIPAAQPSARAVPPAIEPEETRLLARIPEAATVVTRLLDGFAGVQRTSWVGRLHGLLDKPPHPTGAELHDALEDMLTKARDLWGPRFLRACVESIRLEGARASGKMPGKVPATEVRAAVLLDLFRRFDLFAYSGDAAAYELKVYAASEDPQAGPGFRAEIEAVQPWKGIDAPSDFLKTREIAARLGRRAA